MFAFAAAISFGGEPAGLLRRRLARMVEGFPTAPADGSDAVTTDHAATAVLRWPVVARDSDVKPRWHPERQILFSGDVRLYNRPELADRLGVRADHSGPTDLDLAMMAYLEWGADAPGRMVGDFAFVAWNQRTRTLFAARDHLGVRPLYYRPVRGGVLLASDVRQLLPLVPRAYDEVNAERLLHRLSPPARRVGSTYFRGISLLKPGHHLTASPGAITEHRYWVPRTQPSLHRSYAENCEELLRLFRRGVRDRLESDRPIVAHSSGGFDSSTIVMAAHEIYRQDANRPPLVLASALAKGLPCDDSPYMEAIAAKVPFENVTWDALAEEPNPALESELAYPGFSRGPGGGPRGDLALAENLQARVLLGGQGGDDVLFGGGVLLDFFRARRWRRLLDETVVRQPPLRRGLRLLLGSLFGAFSPPRALALRQRVQFRPTRIPPWFGPALRALHPARPPAIDSGDLEWASHVSFAVWTRVNSPQFARVLDSTVVYGAERGLEVRLPYTDVRMVEHLLAMPWTQRIPAGHSRRTGRDALGPLLPDEFQRRRGQGTWTLVWAQSAFHRRATIAALLHDGPWLSAPYVSRTIARSLFRQAVSRGPATDPKGWILLMEFAAVESWLRRLFCYTPAREEATCLTA